MVKIFPRMQYLTSKMRVSSEEVGVGGGGLKWNCIQRTHMNTTHSFFLFFVCLHTADR